ncbi:MAG TPA: ABC transporter ATP-binding protein [Methylomirabilota bacterium]|nr:ABC transporter ATP-binding protein [Methylomirabilota bacterium]
MRIELSGVSKRYGRTRALDAVSLQIEPGQIIALLGSNGAGKTTLLRALATIVGLDRGEIRLDGELLTRDRLDLRRRMMFLPDFPFLFWDQSTLKNIATILRLHEADASGVEKRVVELLRDFDLLPLADTPVQSLSRGQGYKTGLTGLLAVNPELWLLDEPFASGMDPHAIQAFKRHARTAAAAGRTIIYSTQILDVAERFSDRVCVIHEGEIRAFDSLERLQAAAGTQEQALDALFRRLREESK